MPPILSPSGHAARAGYRDNAIGRGNAEGGGVALDLGALGRRQPGVQPVVAFLLGCFPWSRHACRPPRSSRLPAGFLRGCPEGRQRPLARRPNGPVFGKQKHIWLCQLMLMLVKNSEMEGGKAKD